MANRSKSYNAEISKKFDDLEYAQGFLKHLLEIEGLPIDESLREAVKAMGLQKFADKAGISIQAVSDFVSERKKWSTEKIGNHIREVFSLELKISLAPIDSGEVA